MVSNNGLLIFQIVLKQWDKGQRSDVHVSDRAALPDRFRVNVPPAIYAFKRRCIIDTHGDNTQKPRVNFSRQDSGIFFWDRFRVRQSTERVMLDYADPNSRDVNKIETLAIYKDSWVQCKYDWRYSVTENNFIYWLYEELTFNVAWIDEFASDIFLNSAPAFLLEDLHGSQFFS